MVVVSRVATSITLNKVDAIKECNFKTQYRLPSDRIKPLHYDLLLDPNLKSATFVGRVDIDFVVGRVNENDLIDERQIILQAKWNYLTIDETKLRLNLDSNESFKLENICKDYQNEQLILTCDKRLPQNATGKLHIEFKGKFRIDFQGLYLTEYLKYPDSGNRSPINLQYLSTQFESTDARSVFPCFDEPQFKASLQLSLLHAEGLVALANMDQAMTRRLEAQMSESGNTRLVQFAKTPPLSTYLMAFALGHFDYLEQWTGNLRVRVYTLPGRQEEGNFALDVALKGVRLLERAFGGGVKFPCQKLDLVAIPKFKADAMENFGLFFFKAERLHYNEQTTPIKDQLLIVTSVLHELIHQWIGHLVTINWWSDLWLKEGVANYMAYYYAAKLYPRLLVSPNEWFVMQDVVPTIESDSTTFGGSSGRAVLRNNLVTSALVEGTFDSTTYKKGAALVRMLQHQIGDHQFTLTLQDFIKRNLENNHVTSDDFIRELDEHYIKGTNGTSASALPSRWLDSWLRKSGSPKLRVGFDEAKNELIIEQKPQIASKKPLWYVIGEIQITTNGTEAETHGHNPIRSQVINFEIDESQSSAYVQLPSWFEWPSKANPGLVSYLKLNPNFTSVYQVEYSNFLCQQMQLAIENKLMPSIDRLNIINDCFPSLSRAGKLDDFITWFKNEDNSLVLNYLLYLVQSIARDDTTRMKLLETIGGYYDKFGLVTDLHETMAETQLMKMYRGHLMASLIDLQYKPAIGGVLRLSESLELPPQFLRHPMRLAVAAFGTEAQFDLQLALATKSRSTEDQAAAFESFSSGLAMNDPIDYDVEEDRETIRKRRLDKLINWLNSPEVLLENKLQLSRRLS